jgi:hypothetical protein
MMGRMDMRAQDMTTRQWISNATIGTIISRIKYDMK